MPKTETDETDTIDVTHGVRLRMPSGDVYSIAWDEDLVRTIVTLEDAGDRTARTSAMTITPRAANAIELKPRRRDE